MKLVPVKVKIDAKSAVEMKTWAEREGRSRTRHVEILFRKLSTLYQTNPADLIKLGLIDPAAARA